jgi:starvation-inducible outer membrane lipoprotein
MKRTIAASFLVLCLALSGCVSKREARLRSQQSFIAGQQQAMTQVQQGQSVRFIGLVQNSSVPWTEELTLASGIVAADFRGRRDPKMFILRRGAETLTVSAKQLLQGEDFSLQPGDTVEIVP